MNGGALIAVIMFTTAVVGQVVSVADLRVQARTFAETAALQPGHASVSAWVDTAGTVVVAVAVVGARKDDSVDVLKARGIQAELRASLRAWIFRCALQTQIKDFERLDSGLSELTGDHINGRLPPGMRSTTLQGTDHVAYVLEVPIVAGAVDAEMGKTIARLQLAYAIGAVKSAREMQAKGVTSDIAPLLKDSVPVFLSLPLEQGQEQRKWLVASASLAVACDDKLTAKQIYTRLQQLSGSWRRKELAVIGRCAALAGDQRVHQFLAPTWEEKDEDEEIVARLILNSLGGTENSNGAYMAHLGDKFLICVIATAVTDSIPVAVDGERAKQLAITSLKAIIAGSAKLTAEITAPPAPIRLERLDKAIADGFVLLRGPEADMFGAGIGPKALPSTRAFAWAVLGKK